MPEDLILNDDAILPEDDAATAGGEGQQNSSEPAADTGNATLEGQAATQETPQETAQEKQERLFKQSELDAIIKDRFSKQRFEAELKVTERFPTLSRRRRSWGYPWNNSLRMTAMEEQQKLNELIQQNIPPEFAQKLLEHDKIRAGIPDGETDKGAEGKEENVPLNSLKLTR